MNKQTEWQQEDLTAAMVGGGGGPRSGGRFQPLPFSDAEGHACKD